MTTVVDDRSMTSPGGARAFHKYLVATEESLVLTTRRHWVTLLEPVGTALVTGVLALWLMWRMEPELGDGVLVIALLWLAVAARAAYHVMAWRDGWFGATQRRLLLRTGLVTHKVAMMPMEKVTDMSYTRSPLGQVFGYGEFVLESAGQDQALRVIGYVPDPDVTYRLLCEVIFRRGQPVRLLDDGDGSGESPGDEPVPPVPGRSRWESPPPSFPPGPGAPRRPGGAAVPEPAPEAITQLVDRELLAAQEREARLEAEALRPAPDGARAPRAPGASGAQPG